MKKRNTIESFLKSIPDTLGDEALLSLYLQYTEPNAETLAKDLITHYGSLANMIDADPSHVKLSFQLKDETLALIQLLTAFRRRYLTIRSRTDEYLRDEDAITRYLMPLFSGATKEMIYMLCLDEDRKVLGCKMLCEGDSNSVSMSTRVLIQEALLHKASTIVLAHNHPSGQSSPSHADYFNASTVQSQLDLLGISVLDHYVFANDSSQGVRRSHIYDSL